MSLPSLKIQQQVIALSVFVPFSIYYIKQPIKSDCLWAFICLLGAVYVIFRS